jgi:hypothetical protein
MSVNPNQTNLSLSNAYFLPTSTVIPTIYSGTTLLSTTSQIITVSIPGLVSTSTVVPQYCHPGGGAAAQAFNAITPGTNQVIFDVAANPGSNESIVWIAKA